MSVTRQTSIGMASSFVSFMRSLKVLFLLLHTKKYRRKKGSVGSSNYLISILPIKTVDTQKQPDFKKGVVVP